MNIKAFLNTVSNKAYAMPVVIFYITEGCNLKCITCSYREALPGELSFDEIKNLSYELSNFGLRHIVYSGGEPLLRRDFVQICRHFSSLSVKQTLLTNGLLLEKRYDDIKDYLTEIIVSIDGASAETHNKIRGINSFDIILKGIKKISASGNTVSIRTVIQKNNFRQLSDFITLALSSGASRISFLSADVSSDAYGRDKRGTVSDESAIALNIQEVSEFRQVIKKTVNDFKDYFDSGFISESPEKMMKLADYYEALHGKSEFPRNFCNAPMVSAVITSTGDIHPCFFLHSFGNIRKNSFKELVNSPAIRKTRREVKNYSLERCQKCVCTLYISTRNALADKF